MTRSFEKKLIPLWKCFIERVPGEGYTITEWVSGDTAFHRSSENKPNETGGVSSRPKDLPCTDQDALELLDKISKDFPNANTSLIRKKYDDKTYLIAGTVWTPPESNDCFLLKWYDEKSIVSQKSLRGVFSVFCVLLVSLLIITACIWSLQNGYLRIEVGKKQSQPTSINENKNFAGTDVVGLQKALEALSNEVEKYYNNKDDDSEVLVKKEDGVLYKSKKEDGSMHKFKFSEFKVYIEGDDGSPLKGIFRELKKINAKYKKEFPKDEGTPRSGF